MHELDRQLEGLVSQAQLYPKMTDLRKRKIIQDLWDTMLPSATRLRRARPTDDEARRRLAHIKKWANDQYSKYLEGDFQEDWSDVVAEVQREILTKLDIYNKGVDYQIFQKWQIFSEIENLKKPQPNYLQLSKDLENFRRLFKNIRTKGTACESLCSQNPRQQGDLQQSLNDCSEETKQLFLAEIPKFSRRFQQRRTKNGTKAYPPEKAQLLEQACETLRAGIQSQSVDLQAIWNTFCDQMQQLYRPFKFWNWFDYYIKKRFIDIIRQRLNIVSGDAKVETSEEDSTTQTRLDKVKAKAESKISVDVIRLIHQDPDGIFAAKHIKNFPDVNFREIALVKFQEFSLETINQHFGDQVNAQTTISPFYCRSCHYFKPIIEEYLEAQLALPRAVIEQIVNDSEGKYNRRTMPEHSQISFKGIIDARSSGGVQSWTILARQLEVNVKDLIYFYLDGISYFKLMTKTKTKTRTSKNNSQPIDE